MKIRNLPTGELSFLIQECLDKVTAPDKKYEKLAQEHLNKLTKPVGSLGVLEKMLVRLAGIQRKAPGVRRKQVMIFAADHGVSARGVSAYPKELTAQMVLNFLRKGAAINVLAGKADAKVKVIDIGVDADFASHPNLQSVKVARGTRDLSRENAMSQEECNRAIEVGIRMAEVAVSEGFDLLIMGEMGIGNTTPAAVLFCTLLGMKAEDIVGKGTGLTVAGWNNKVAVVKEALKLHQDEKDIISILAASGGLDIAGLCGMCIGAAANGVAVMVDGFISTSAALMACALKPEIKSYLFFAHCSDELGHRRVLEAMEERGILDLNLRLGEGTGAVLASQLLDSACAVYHEMASFEEAGISTGDHHV